jgi:hypothetical protein
MRRVLLLFLIGVGLLIQPGASLSAALTPQEGAQEAEAAFRSAMEAWAYEEFWRLWDMGSNASRSALSREAFTEKLRNGNARPAAGRQVEAVQVLSSFPDSAVLQVRFGLEDKRRPWTASTDRRFLLRLEDGHWTVDLWDFVGLANYFPSDFFPGPPLLVPPRNPPRLKGLVR